MTPHSYLVSAQWLFAEFFFLLIDWFLVQPTKFLIEPCEKDESANIFI